MMSSQKYNEETIEQYEATLTLTQWQLLWKLRQNERQFAKDCGYDFGYGRYWETLTIDELIEAQKANN